MTTLTTDTPLPPPPPSPKARRKPRPAPPPRDAVGGSAAPSGESGDTAPAAEDQATDLSEALQTAKLEAEGTLDATGIGYPTLAAADVPAPVPLRRDLAAVADEYAMTDSQSSWRKCELVMEAFALDPERAVAVLARRAHCSRARMSEQRTVGLHFANPLDRDAVASFDSHLVAIKLARAQTPDAPVESIRQDARFILMQEPNYLRLRRRLREESGKNVVPPSPPAAEGAVEEQDAAPNSTSAFEEALAAIGSVRTFLDAAPPVEQYEEIVAALKAVLAEAKAARTVTEFEPDKDHDVEDGCDPDREDDGEADDEDHDLGSGDDDENGDDGNLDYEFED